MLIAMTGGHHSSALPLIDYIFSCDSKAKIIWFGHKHSAKGDKNPTLEYLQITEKNIPFIDLPAGKFYRNYDPVRLAKIPWGFVVAFYQLLKYKPDVIFSFGGYLAVPVVISGWILGIPSVTHEQTVVTGYANRLIGKFARKILVSHQESLKFFPVSKTMYSGLPLRKDLFEVQSHSFVFDNDLPVLYITAGKTGSHIINEAIQKCLEKLLIKFNIIHQCGDHSLYQDYDKLNSQYRDILVKNPSNSLGKYYLRKFILDDEIGEVFALADVLLSRSGAHTVKEIETFQKPAVLVPIPWVSHNEQYLNARVLEKLGLGIIIPENELNCPRIISSLEQVLKLNSDKAKPLNFKPDFSLNPVEIMYQTLCETAKGNFDHEK